MIEGKSTGTAETEERDETLRYGSAAGGNGL